MCCRNIIDFGDCKCYNIGTLHGLWFGNWNKRSLVNNNQHHYYGVNICDEKIEKYCTLGDEKESFSFPMKMYDITCDFVSRYPIYDELETCRRFLLSYENFWDP